MCLCERERRIGVLHLERFPNRDEAGKKISRRLSGDRCTQTAAAGRGEKDREEGKVSVSFLFFSPPTSSFPPFLFSFFFSSLFFSPREGKNSLQREGRWAECGSHGGGIHHKVSKKTTNFWRTLIRVCKHEKNLENMFRNLEKLGDFLALESK